MIRGHIDAVTRDGFIEGWAFDDEDLARIVAVRVVGPGEQELARGLANLYRGDLAEVDFRYGWCAFRLRLARGAAELSGTPLALHDAADDQEIHATESWHVRETADDPMTELGAVLAQDPTVLPAVDHLHGCRTLFARFVARHGIERFVQTAYCYVLGRPADEAGMEGYARLLRAGALTPYGLLMLLAGSEEFRSRPRLLASPADPGFVFAETGGEAG